MALASVSLIEHHTFEGGAPAVTLHRMVQAAMRARVALGETLKGVLGRGSGLSFNSGAGRSL